MTPAARTARREALERFARAFPEALDVALEHAGPDLDLEDALVAVEAEITLRRPADLPPSVPPEST